MASFAQGKIEAFVGPRELGAADDLEQVIVAFIEGAKESLDIAVQELDSEVIAQALIDARWRGVSVRAFLEQDYLLSPKLPKATPRRNEAPADALRRVQWEELRQPPERKTNRDIAAALLRSNIDFKSDYNPAIFHQKFVIRDYRGRAMRTSALLTGSANWTQTDCHTNLNHVIVFHNAKVCAEYQREFDEIRGGSFGRRQHGNVPTATNIGGIPVKILFAPDHTPELEIVKQMLRAEQRLDFAIFT
ncbi:MAG TPA: phospholipase D-like domain-containing protein, partial [Solirubrobacteraceae bacterium]